MTKAQSSEYFELSGPNGSIEFEAVVSFTFIRGCAAHYGSLSYAGDPGEPDSIEDATVEAIYPLFRNASGSWARGPQLDAPQWLKDFCLSAINEDQLLEDYLADA